MGICCCSLDPQANLVQASSIGACYLLAIPQSYRPRVSAHLEADPIAADPTLPAMPFPKRPWHRRSVVRGQGKPPPQIYSASRGVLEGICLFSITYTKIQ
jgi:hypothetical protein